MTVNVTPQTLLWEEMEEKENYRRAQADQIIRALPSVEGTEARAKETQLRAQYDLRHPVKPAKSVPASASVP